MAEAGVLGQEDRAARLVVGRGGLQAALECRRQLGVDRIELGLHLPQRDERQHWLGVLVRAERVLVQSWLAVWNRRRERS